MVFSQINRPVILQPNARREIKDSELRKWARSESHLRRCFCQSYWHKRKGDCLRLKFNSNKRNGSLCGWLSFWDVCRIVNPTIVSAFTRGGEYRTLTSFIPTSKCQNSEWNKILGGIIILTVSHYRIKWILYEHRNNHFVNP